MSTLHRSKKNQAKSNGKGLHPRNLHRQGYDLPLLVKSYPPLAKHVKANVHGNLSVDFADPLAVKALNAALLTRYYDVIDWDIPAGALCPPIPGRADYIHYVAELLGIDEAATNLTSGAVTTMASTTSEPKITLLDIGTGANGIYPLLACQIYGWDGVGSDINDRSLDNVASIITRNPALKGGFELRLQPDKNHIFNGIIRAGEFFDVSVCNPPFHASEDEATRGSRIKLNNLARNRAEKIIRPIKSDTSRKTLATAPSLNFGGLEAELWCNGGERLFLKRLIKESRVYSAQCRWFTTLVSKADNVKPAIKLIRKLGAIDIREIEMKQGNKRTRILAWTFI